MSKRIFTKEQIQELSRNKNVGRCSSKSITYSKDFKVFAVRRYYEGGYSPQMIFQEARFDLNMIGRDSPKYCLNRWRKTHRTKGIKELTRETRGGGMGGGRKQKRHKDDLEYLKTKIAYLEEENSFLAKLRGLKRE